LVPSVIALQSRSIGFMEYRLPEETRLPFAIASQVSPLFAVYERPGWQVDIGEEFSTGMPLLGSVIVPPGSPHAVIISVQRVQRPQN
jgi:hypothetical protein